jgi:hypothetical protein
VHPIEQLRWVARAEWAPAPEVAAEAAWSLGALARSEPWALLPACRRLLERRPSCAALWWVAAEVLGAPDPAAAAERCATLLEEDPSRAQLGVALAEDQRAVARGATVEELARAELVVVPVEALGPEGFLVDADGAALLAGARELGLAIWLVAGVGTVLSPGLFAALRRRLPPGRGLEPLEGVEAVVCPFGRLPLAAVFARVSCSEPPELTGWADVWGTPEAHRPGR